MNNICCSTSKNDEGKEQIFPNPTMLPLSFQPLNFTHTIPLFRQPNPSFPLLLEASRAACRVHEYISRSVDKCMKLVEKIASQHGFLERITSLSSHLQASVQIPRLNPPTVMVPYGSSFAAILPGDSVAGIVVTNGILNFLNIYNTLLVVRLVLTWFPNAPPAVVSPLSTLCDPYLNIFRGIIPPLGGTLDLSPILAFLVLNAFTSTASALPAELPSSSPAVDSPTMASNLTAAQQKWIRRLSGKKF